MINICAPLPNRSISESGLSRKKEEFQQYAVSTLLNDLIPVLDDFDRSALRLSHSIRNDASKVVDGIRLIQKRLYDTLSNKYGLSRYESQWWRFRSAFARSDVLGSVAMYRSQQLPRKFMPGYKLHDLSSALQK
jgi:molecular chaperone GrpE (heat shock protein)